ncbi:MAG: SIR2 family NAD-dependent protein deacylase [Anaerolineae bacterium]
MGAVEPRTESVYNPVTSSEVDALLRKLRAGQVVLFLGAGACADCTSRAGTPAPLARQLAQLIHDRFFGDDSFDYDLQTISQYAIDRDGRRALERFIYETLIDLQPSQTLARIAQLPWRAIYTTNFDVLLEKAYEAARQPAQRLRLIHSDMDQIDNIDPAAEVIYCKLHGCISRLSAPPGLVLTAEDYASGQEERRRMYARLKSQLYDFSFVFIGYGLTDPDFVSLYNEVRRSFGADAIPKSYAVATNVHQVVRQSWSSRRIAVMDMKASEFITLAGSAPAPRPQLPVSPEVASLREDLAPQLDVETASLVFREFERVDDRLGYGELKHDEFYRGGRPTWEVVRHECDAGRDVCDQILDEVLYVPEAARLDPLELVVVTAEAGAGKSTLLMRLAYDHARYFEGFCLFHKPYRGMSVAALEELCRAVRRRVFVYVDDAADYIVPIALFAERARSQQLSVTIVCAERKNEWNAVADRVNSVRVAEYQLDRLSDAEIGNVLYVLERHHYLCELGSKSVEDRRSVFKERAEKQLLVAMREATEGTDFDRIIQNEYDSIPSDQARRTYLQVCALHRFGVPVRAGLLHRLSGVSFADFQDKLLSPCERVVDVTLDEAVGDYYYRARHQYIAEMVCHHALRDPALLAEVYLSVLSALDLGYSSDLQSFRRLARADAVIDAMPGPEHRRLFYDRAVVLSHGDPYVYQQYALMEMRHEELEHADELLALALRAEPRNYAFKHSYATLLSRRAARASNPVQRDVLLKQSQDGLTGLMATDPSRSYAYASYAENLLSSARLADETTRYLLLKEAHEVVQRGLRRCTAKAYLLATDARVMQALGDRDRAIVALTRSHEEDPTSVRTTLLLARLLLDTADSATALSVVSETLRYNELDHSLNLLGAEIAMSSCPPDHRKSAALLKKVYDPTYVDTEANFLLAVEYYVTGATDAANEIFDGFRNRASFKRDSGSYQIRRYALGDDHSKTRFNGTVSSIAAGGKYGYIRPDLIADRVYFRPWFQAPASTALGKRVGFHLGFNLLGPIAIDVTLETTAVARQV